MKRLGRYATACIFEIENAKKIRELVQELKTAGFYEISGGGKGSHRKFVHKNYASAVTINGKTGDDAKTYQER